MANPECRLNREDLPAYLLDFEEWVMGGRQKVASTIRLLRHLSLGDESRFGVVMMGHKTMRTNNTGSIPLCEKLDTKRRNVKEAHTQREQGCQLTTSSMCLMMEGT